MENIWRNLAWATDGARGYSADDVSGMAMSQPKFLHVASHRQQLEYEKYVEIYVYNKHQTITKQTLEICVKYLIHLFFPSKL